MARSDGHRVAARREAISAITAAELAAGPHLAATPGEAARRQARLQEVEANLGRPEDPGAQPSGLVVLTLTGERIAAITRFLDPELPSILAGTGADLTTDRC